MKDKMRKNKAKERQQIERKKKINRSKNEEKEIRQHEYYERSCKKSDNKNKRELHG
jgi:hypothetical protein